MSLSLSAESLKGIKATDILGVSIIMNVDWISGYCVPGNF